MNNGLCEIVVENDEDDKVHPFDFDFNDIALIKEIFPDFKKKKTVSKVSYKEKGVLIKDLK